MQVSVPPTKDVTVPPSGVETAEAGAAAVACRVRIVRAESGMAGDEPVQAVKPSGSNAKAKVPR
jgi:hypothetical protein